MNPESTSGTQIASRGDFVQAAARLLMALPDAKPRELLIVDALTSWIRLPGRRLRLLGSRFDVVARDQPRLAAWRRSFAHAIECFTPTDVEAADVPSLLLSDGVGLELLDRERFVARQADDRRWLVLQRERTDALLQRSEPAWPVTVLGL